MTAYVTIDHYCPSCHVQAVQRDGIVTVPHDEKCPVWANPLLIAARNGSSS